MRGRRGRRSGSRGGSSSGCRPPLCMAVGNCTVEVDGSTFTCGRQSDDCLLISTTGPAQIRVSAAENSSVPKDFSFVMLNPNDMNDYSVVLAQDVLKIYTKELPNMNYAANTGKRSRFLEKCVTGGKYETLALRSNSSKEHGEVIAAVSFQIIASDSLYSEIPLAAVFSKHQKKGIGRLLYSELRKRLQSVGILTVFCWADAESKGFWDKQGFTSIGDVDGKGRARKLPIRASVRKALCFPGDSMLMVSHLNKDVVHTGLAPCEMAIADSIDDDAEMNNGEKRCLWEASLTSLKSKRIKGSHPSDCGISDEGSTYEHCLGDESKCKYHPDTSPNNEEILEIHTGACSDVLRREPNVFFMNISDENKKIRLTKIVEELGGRVASDGRSCTHIITGKALRTLNFCTALCSGAWIVSSDWLKESYREKRFTDESGFVLEDDDYVSRYKSTVKDAMMRARSNPGSLLRGYNVCLGNHVQPPSNILSIIISSAGGDVIYEVMSIVEPSKTVFIACEEDMEEALLAARMGIWTFNSDWLMSCIMRQELDFGAPQFSEPL